MKESQRLQQVGARELLPGDVILTHGRTFVAWAIRRFDGSDVNHAAIVLDPDTLGEASGSGLKETSIELALEGIEFAYVRRLSPEVEVDAVVDEARAFLSDEPSYAHVEILQLAILSTTRRLPLWNPWLRPVLRTLLDRAAGLADALAARGRDLMVSSDYVFRCYEECGDPRLRLEILLPDERPTRAAAAVSGDDVTLIDWAASARLPEARRSQVEGARVPSELDAVSREAGKELAPLIEDFARRDSPDDPLVSALQQGPGAEADAGALPESIPDDGLHASAVRFRDAFLRLGYVDDDVSASSEAEDRWELFRTVAAFVTPGDLLYSPSLHIVALLRP